MIVLLICCWFAGVVALAEVCRRRAEPLPKMRQITEYELQLGRIRQALLDVAIRIGTQMQPVMARLIGQMAALAKSIEPLAREGRS